MEVDVVINDQLAENAAITDEHHRDHKVDRRTLLENKKYHVFFCYRDVPNDKLWVKEAVKKLENDFGFICCDHERDFLAGTKVISNIKFGIKNSEKVVCVLSKEGLDSRYLQLETELAYKEGIDKRENLLIPVLLDDCEIPDELKLLTYIDARKEINETTWWPKLIAAIESKAECSFFKGRKEEETKDKSENQPTYYFQQLCSIETTFSFKHCSLQNTSKYIPKELASMDAVVSVETIKNIKRDLLDAPRIKCRQTCVCFCTGLLCLILFICLFGFVFPLSIAISCATTTTNGNDDCFGLFGICVLIIMAIGICFGVGFRCYYKVPKSIDTKITEYNTELIKSGILITLVYTQLWKTAYIVFYRASFDSCKQYILFHMREDRKTKRETFVNISEITAQHDADDIPIWTRSGNEDLALATKTLHCRHDIKLETETLVDTFEMQEYPIAEDVPLLDLSDNDQLDQLTEQYIIFHLREDRKPERETFVNISETEAQHYADDIPILTQSGNEDLAQATKNLHCRHDMNLETETLVDTSEMQENHIAEDVPLLDLSDNDRLDQLTEVYPNNVGLRQKDDDQGSTIVNLSEQDNRPQQFTQNSQCPHSLDLGNIENVAMTLLLMYAHEYLRLVFNGKMKNPKEDRHIPDCTCLCQYIEKTDKKFRKLVDKNKIIHAKYSSIEHNTKEILDALRL